MSARGTTLLELLVVLLILSISAGLSVLAIGSLRVTPEMEKQREWETERRRAVHQGRQIQIVIDSGGVVRLVRFLPDGRVLAQ